MFRLAALLAAIVALVSLCGPAAADPAAQIIVPLTIDYLTLGAALKRQIYDAPGGRAILWKGTNDCEFLYAEQSALRSERRRDGRARVRRRAWAGRAAGGQMRQSDFVEGHHRD